MIETDVALHIGEYLCILCIHDIRFRIHDFTEALESGIAVLELLGKIHQCAHRFGKYTDVKHKGNQVLHLQPAVSDQHCARHEHTDLNQCCKSCHSGLEHAHIVIAVFL